MMSKVRRSVVDSLVFKSVGPAFFALFATAGCLSEETLPGVQELDSSPVTTAPAHLSALPVEGSPEAVGALIVANDCRMTAAILAEEAGLFVHAAGAIAGARAGRDRACDTGDDHRFRSLGEILELPYTGPRNIERLVRFAETAGAMPLYEGGTVAGVQFTDAEAFNALTAANAASLSILDREAGLRADAAANIIEARPIKALAELAAVYRVGPVTLERLRNWSSPRVQGGFVLDAFRYAEIEDRGRAFLLANDVFTWDLVQLSDYDEDALQEIEMALDAELRRIVETSLFGRPFPTLEAASQAVLQAASGIQRQVRVDGWRYLQSLGL